MKLFKETYYVDTMNRFSFKKPCSVSICRDFESFTKAKNLP